MYTYIFVYNNCGNPVCLPNICMIFSRGCLLQDEDFDPDAPLPPVPPDPPQDLLSVCIDIAFFGDLKSIKII